jgi:hypothetical protein
MSKYMRPVLIGLVVGFVVAFGLGLLYGSIGEGASNTPWYTGAGAGVVTAYILSNLAGSRAGGASATPDRKRQVLAAAPAAGKALLYLYREGFVAKLAGLNVSVDGREVVQLKSPRFTCVTVPAGSHTISAAFGGLAGVQSKPSDVTVDAPADGAIAVRITMKMGAVQGGIALTPQSDMAAVKLALAKMPMTPADVSEV